MSGLLRRLKRSRAAGAGEVPAADHDAVPEAAPTPPTDLEGKATTPVTASRPSLFSDPDRPVPPPPPRLSTDDEPWPVAKGESASEDTAPSLGVGARDATPQSREAPSPVGGTAGNAGEQPTGGGTQTGARAAARTGTTGDARTASSRTGAPLGGTLGGAPPDISRDSSMPAGLDPAEARVRPPAGRRGRLRRRLRYLRRARELMLRDLGGLVYEIHRTGGGDMPAHIGLVAAKVQRMVTLDVEAHALEAALGAPREHVMLFEPGVGGTCDVCGELYASDARFCANCGTPTSGEPVRQAEQEAAAEPGPASERAPTLAEPGREPVAPLPEPPPERPSRGAEAPTSQMTPVDEPTVAVPVTDVDRVAAAADAASEERDDRSARPPHADPRPGEDEREADRPRERTLTPGDPVAWRERRP